MIGPVYEDLRKAAQAETERAKAAYGDIYASPHEAFGVLMEEWDEAMDELKLAESRMARLSRALRNPGEMLRKLLDDVQYHAMLTACELIQVAAVCIKALDTLDQKEADDGDHQREAESLHA